MTNYPIEPCETCDALTLIVDEDASNLLCDDGSTLVTLAFPRRVVLERAHDIAANVLRHGPRDDRDVIIQQLLHGFTLTVEILSRLSIYGVDGTGDADADDLDFQRALEAAHDISCAFGREEQHVEFWDVQIDISNVLCVFDPDVDAPPLGSNHPPIAEA